MPDWSSSLILATRSVQLGPGGAAGPVESAVVIIVSCGACKASVLNPAIIPLQISCNKISRPVLRIRPPSAGVQHVQLRLLEGRGRSCLRVFTKVLVEANE